MKKHLLALAASLSALVIFSACKTSVQVTNGEVPSQYLEHAKKAEGVYHGQFNGVSGDLIVSFSANRPVVRFRNKNGSDILNSGCKSKIGSARQAEVTGDNDNFRINSAVFDFDPGQCRKNIDGRSFLVDFKEKNGTIVLDVKIAQKSTHQQKCGWWGRHYYGDGGAFDYEYRYGWDRDYPYNQYTHYRRSCRIEQTDLYLYGRFTK